MVSRADLRHPSHCLLLFHLLHIQVDTTAAATGHRGCSPGAPTALPPAASL